MLFKFAGPLLKPPGFAGGYLLCNEAKDYDKPTRLSKSGLQKAANVIRFGVLELDAGARRSEVFF